MFSRKLVTLLFCFNHRGTKGKNELEIINISNKKNVVIVNVPEKNKSV